MGIPNRQDGFQCAVFFQLPVHARKAVSSVYRRTFEFNPIFFKRNALNFVCSTPVLVLDTDALLCQQVLNLLP